MRIGHTSQMAKGSIITNTSIWGWQKVESPTYKDTRSLRPHSKLFTIGWEPLLIQKALDKTALRYCSLGSFTINWFWSPPCTIAMMIPPCASNYKPFCCMTYPMTGIIMMGIVIFVEIFHWIVYHGCGPTESLLAHNISKYLNIWVY